ncbi:hypothetical protein L9F63_009256, partial [Diploptera punctata]
NHTGISLDHRIPMAYEVKFFYINYFAVKMQVDQTEDRLLRMHSSNQQSQTDDIDVKLNPMLIDSYLSIPIVSMAKVIFLQQCPTFGPAIIRIYFVLTIYSSDYGMNVQCARLIMLLECLNYVTLAFRRTYTRCVVNNSYTRTHPVWLVALIRSQCVACSSHTHAQCGWWRIRVHTVWPVATLRKQSGLVYRITTIRRSVAPILLPKSANQSIVQIKKLVERNNELVNTKLSSFGDVMGQVQGLDKKINTIAEK